MFFKNDSKVATVFFNLSLFKIQNIISKNAVILVGSNKHKLFVRYSLSDTTFTDPICFLEFWKNEPGRKGFPEGMKFFFFFFFFFIHYHEAGFYKPIIPQSPPSHLPDYSTCSNARLEFFSQFFVPSFDPNEWCLKNGLHSGGLNPGPPGHESSALTTRPRLLAMKFLFIH